MIKRAETTRPLSDKAIEGLEQRGLSPEVASRMGIYSGAQKKDGERSFVEPDSRGRIICFPFWDKGVEVNTKYRTKDRDGNKIFWQTAGGKKTFYNADVLDDPSTELVIVEGEMDTIAVETAGYHVVVSVPDGAPATRDQHGQVIEMRPESEIDPEHDEKYKFIIANWDRLKHFKRIILACDADEPGQRLVDELARRLGKVRCAFVAYPPEPCVEAVTKAGTRELRPCKDMNEVLQHHGADAVLDLIAKAKPYPVSGLYTLDDFREVNRIYYQVGFAQLRDRIRLYEGAFVIVSGLPGSGKSAVVDQLAFNMAVVHGWRVCHAHFEEDVKPEIHRKLRHYYLLKNRSAWSMKDKAEADNFIRQHYCFVTRDLNNDDDEITVEWLLDRLADAVLRHGIKIAVIDPWNELLHKKQRGEQRDEYINRALSMLKRFGKQYGVVMIIVAHPTKEAHKADGKEKKGPMSLYDISDGAAWANKAELGIIIYRVTHTEVASEFIVKKVKFKGTGMIGQSTIVYDETVESFIT